MDYTTVYVTPTIAVTGEVPPAFFIGLFLIFAIIGLALHIFSAYCLYIIAKKTNTNNAWLAWIPIFNIFLMLKIARKPWWWIFGLLIPILNIVLSVIVWMQIAEERRRPRWWGLLMLISIVNFVIMYLLAFEEAPNAVAQVSPTPPPASPENHAA